MYFVCIGVIGDVGCFHVHQSQGVDLLKAIIHQGDPESDKGSNNNLPWCICGHCRHIPLEVEKVCCRRRVCIMSEEFFQAAVLDMNVLSIAMVNRSNVFADDSEYTSSTYRKVAYHQWILCQNGYLGRVNRRVIPSCLVWAVYNRYPSPNGH